MVTINELIAQKEKIQGKRAQKYEFETSVGQILCKLPSSVLVGEAIDMTPSTEGNAYLVYNCVIEPNLRDAELQKEFGVAEPTDIVKAIFLPGEVAKIAGKLMDLAGYKGKIVSRIHAEVKN